MEDDREDEDLAKRPDERDADLGWSGPDLSDGPTTAQRLRQYAFYAILVLLLAALLTPLIVTATR
jgi:hypothetical protein